MTIAHYDLQRPLPPQDKCTTATDGRTYVRKVRTDGLERTTWPAVAVADKAGLTGHPPNECRAQYFVLCARGEPRDAHQDHPPVQAGSLNAKGRGYCKNDVLPSNER